MNKIEIEALKRRPAEAERLAIDEGVKRMLQQYGLDGRRQLAEPLLRGSMKVRDGELVFRDDAGAIVGEASFVGDLKRVVPQLFSAPVKKSNPETAENPFRRGPAWNLTKQFEIERADPERARKLKLEADRASR